MCFIYMYVCLYQIDLHTYSTYIIFYITLGVNGEAVDFDQTFNTTFSATFQKIQRNEIA